MNQKQFDTLKDFIRFVKKELEIQSLPKIKLVTDKSFVESNRSFGEYNVAEMSVRVYITGRNLADICRSLAHELVHHRQSELNLLYNSAGETGSNIENDANSIAGILMREYGRLNLSIYDLETVKGAVNEIGDGMKTLDWSYDFVDDDGNYHYSFKTPKNNYTAAITYEGDDTYTVYFNTEGEMGLDTEEGVALQVISTVMAITLDFIRKEQPAEVRISPIKTKGETDTRRANVYGAYVKKNVPPNYSLMKVADGYRFIRKLKK